MTKRLFISYSHKDAALLDELVVHLRPLERSGVVQPWSDRYILAGDDIDRDVREALKSADIIALLVSPSFLASDYCYEREMEEAVARHERGEARVLPIIARACQWEETPFGRLRGTPTDNKPIMSRSWPDKDEAWNIVAKDIALAARQSAKASVAAPAPTPPLPEKAEVPKFRGSGLPIPAVGAATDRDKDMFLRACFQTVSDEFEAAINALEGALSGHFEKIDARTFTATIYRDGKRVAGCTIWSGSRHMERSIAYHSSDDGQTNSMNDYVSVEVSDGGLMLRSGMSGYANKLDAHETAQHFWSRFVEPINRSRGVRFV